MPGSRYTPSTDPRGFTLIELLIVVGLISTIAAIAVPGLFRARVSGNEASAIASIRAIITAQQDFAALTQGFADDLATLASTCPSASAPFLSPDLASNGVTKSGYVFTVAPGAGSFAGPTDCFGNPTQSAFYASAVPFNIGFSGNRGYASNNASTIWEDETGAAPTEPFTITATVHPVGQ